MAETKRRPSSGPKGAVSAFAGLHLGGDVWKFQDAGSPTDGTSGTGAGWAGPGSEYTDTTGAKLYINTNTKASPTWTVVGSQS